MAVLGGSPSSSATPAFLVAVNGGSEYIMNINWQIVAGRGVLWRELQSTCSDMHPGLNYHVLYPQLNWLYDLKNSDIMIIYSTETGLLLMLRMF